MKNNLTNDLNNDFEVLNPEDYLTPGQWVWVKDWHKEHLVPGLGHDDEAFVCITHIGSNFVKVCSPRNENSQTTARIHFEDIGDKICIESEPDKVLTMIKQHFEGLSNKYLSQVKEITARLGCTPTRRMLSDNSSGSSQALAVLSSHHDVDQYKKDLIDAKEVVLPEVFKKLKKANANLAKWMSAETLTLEVNSNFMKDSIDKINSRITNVSLYAGLTEDVVCCTRGEPAEYHEKLHIMQSRKYMDEESLLNYQHGGMDFENITEFDDWISKPENMERILPFNRCIVSMKVRREGKVRDAVSLSHAFVNFRLGQLDKLTFLYIRNGENLFRLNCDFDFGALIFPEQALFNPDEPMMFRKFANTVDRFMSVAEYDSIIEEINNYNQWNEDNPDKEYYENPFRGSSHFRTSEWYPFNDSCVHYDDALKVQVEKLNKYNRIALIIQGLFDRSEVLHPHPPVKSWTPEGFAQAIELVYDGSAVLTDGDKPDFEAYRAKCNALITPDSVISGQFDYWVNKETEKECRRLDNTGRYNEYRPNKFIPEGNPGPGVLARMSDWKPRAQKAVFRWYRERLSQRWDFDSVPIRTTITVPVEHLFNVSAYCPGDYLLFFSDPRTRMEYLKWAPMLIAAEEYHAGNIEVKEPV